MPQPTATVAPDRIIPLHGVRDPVKLHRIRQAMVERGWEGRPILVHREGAYYHAWMGSHRVHAATEAGINVPVYELTLPGGNPPRPHPSVYVRNRDRLRLLRDYGDQGAIALMAEEMGG